MKKLLSMVLMLSMVFGFTYTFAYKPSDDKLHCKVCNNTHFINSKRLTKFTIENGEPVIRTGSFYKCSDCGMLSDIRVHSK